LSRSVYTTKFEERFETGLLYSCGCSLKLQQIREI